MTKRPMSPAALGIAGIYFLLFLLFLWPATDYLTTVWAPRLGEVEWRYGAIGLLTAHLLTPVLAMGLAMVVAFALRHRTTLKALSVLSLVGALILIVAMAFFALDVMQLRNVRPPESLPSFQAGALIAELKHFTAFIALTLLGLGGWSTAGRLRDANEAAEKPKRGPDLVKKPEGKRKEGAEL